MTNQWFSDHDYKKFIARFPICTVDTLFFDHDKKRILLFKRKNKPLKGVFFSAGGRMFKNETFADCAFRQSKKELGLSINKRRLVFGGIINEIHAESRYPHINYHSVNIYFGYVLGGQKIKLDNQHSYFKWFLVRDKSLHPFIKEKIKTLLRKI